jgi:hypothetical protein
VNRRDALAIHTAAKSITIGDGSKTAPVPLAARAERFHQTG